MAITTLELVPSVGSVITLNNDTYPLDEFDITPEYDVKAIKKPRAAGEWPTFVYPGAMTIVARGAILGSSSSDCGTKRNTLIEGAGPILGTQTIRRHVRIRIQMDWMTEKAEAECCLVAREFPLRALSPGVAEFMCTWKSWLPYFIGLTSGTPYELG